MHTTLRINKDKLLGMLYESVLNTLNEVNFNQYRKAKNAGQNGAKGKGYLKFSGSKSNLVDKQRDRTKPLDSQNYGNEKEYIIACISHVYADNQQDFITAINTTVPESLIYAQVGKRPGTVEVIINAKQKEEVEEYLEKIKNKVKQFGKYNDKSVDTAFSKLYMCVDETPMISDVENAEKAGISNWEDILKRLEDPEVKERLRKFMLSDDYADSYGHRLSPRNVANILLQCPTASFVVEKSTWEKVFKRRVKSNAQPIIVTKAEGYASYDELDAAAKELGYKSYADAKKTTDNATQVMHQIEVKANSGNGKYIHDIKMYDVADTVPINPQNDIWTNTIGLRDNIVGVLNDKAQQYDDINRGDKGNEATKKMIEANRAEVTESIGKVIENRKEALIKLCQDNKIPIDEIMMNDGINFIARATFLYVYNKVPEYGYIKDSDKKRISALCACVICTSTGSEIPSDLARLVALRGDIPKEDAFTAYQIADKLLPLLLSASRAKNVKPIKIIKSNDPKKIEKFKKQYNEARIPNMISFETFISMTKKRYGLINLDNQK